MEAKDEVNRNRTCFRSPCCVFSLFILVSRSLLPYNNNLQQPRLWWLASSSSSGPGWSFGVVVVVQPSKKYSHGSGGAAELPSVEPGALLRLRSHPRRLLLRASKISILYKFTLSLCSSLCCLIDSVPRRLLSALFVFSCPPAASRPPLQFPRSFLFLPPPSGVP